MTNKTTTPPRFNPDNERLKREYAEFVEAYKGNGKRTVESILKSIARYEAVTDYAGFDTFSRSDSLAFKKALETGKNRDGNPISAAQRVDALRHLKEFFTWLSRQVGFRRSLSLTDVGYFNPARSDKNSARVPSRRKFATIDQIRAVLEKMPDGSDLEMRDRAIIAFTLVSAMRDTSIVTLRLKHVDINQREIILNPNETKSKFGKHNRIAFFRVGDDIIDIVVGWVLHLRKLGYTDDAPLFPRTRMSQSEVNIRHAAGLDEVGWTNAGYLRAMFRKAFLNAGLEPVVPHSFRKTIARSVDKRRLTEEQRKALSQSLGHENLITTDSYYGVLPEDRQVEVMKELNLDVERSESGDDDPAELLARLSAIIKKAK